MSKIKILTCSQSGIPTELAAEMGIIMFPYYVAYEGDSYNEFELDSSAFYRWMRSSTEMPTTSHPTLQDFLNIFREAGRDGSELIYISVSSKYSKSFDLAAVAQKQLPELNISIYDSQAGAGGQGLIALNIAGLAKEGMKPAEIHQCIPDYIKNCKFLIVFDTLKYLAKGGRIGKAQSLLGSVMRIKPILSYENGETVPVGRVRTAAQGLDFIAESIQAEKDKTGAKNIYCVVEDADNREWANSVVERIQKEFNPTKLWQWTMTPIVGAHVGPGAWSVAFSCF